MLPQQSIVRVNFCRLAKSWMTGFESKKFIGLNDLGLIGSSMGTRIQNFSTLKRLNEDKEILFKGLLTHKAIGLKKWRLWQVWWFNILPIYSAQVHVIRLRNVLKQYRKS